MSKKQRIQEVQDQIRKLEIELFELGFDSNQIELEENLRFQQAALEEAHEHLKSFEDEVRWWTKEIAKIKKDIEKLQTKLAERQLKKKPKKS